MSSSGAGKEATADFAALPEKPCTMFFGVEVRKETSTVQEWLDVWGKRAKDASDFEPETSAYAGCISMAIPKIGATVSNDNEVLVFERYSTGRKAIESHSARQAHRELVKEQLELRNTKRATLLNLWSEDLWGFARKDRPPPPTREDYMNGKGPVLLIAIWRFANEAVREEYIRVSSQEFVPYCWEKEPGTLTYYGGLIQQPTARGPKVQKGDILLVWECVDEDAAVKHHVDPVHQALGKRFGPNRELIHYQTWRVTGTGYMTRPENSGWFGGKWAPPATVAKL